MKLPIVWPFSKLSLRKKGVIINLTIIFVFIGTAFLILKQLPKKTSYRTKAGEQPNPQCSLVVEVVATPTQTPTIGPTSTPTTRPTATPTTRPTATPTSIKPTFTPTPTPTPTRIPIPDPFPSCGSLTMTESDGTNDGAIALGQSVTFQASGVKKYGILRAGKCKDNNNCNQVYGDTNLIGDGNLAFGNTTFTKTFTPSETGKYVFEVNVYEGENCDFLCSAGTYRYQYNTRPTYCTRSASNFDRIDGPGTCTNNCRKFLWVYPVRQ